jgi:hypothetical protein
MTPLESDLGLSQTALYVAQELGKKDAKDGKITPELDASLLDKAKSFGFKVGGREGGRQEE